MDFKVNANMGVRVKLNDEGVEILKERHNELNRRIKIRGGVGLGEFALKTDNDGYYKTQLWLLMNIFGPYMSISNNPPFNMDIIIENGEPLDSQEKHTL